MAGNYITSPAGTADISDTAGVDQYLVDAPFAGKINVAKCFVRWSEATGSQTSTIGTIDLKVGGTTVGTMTASQSGAVGDTTAFTVDGTAATSTDPWVTFAAGDAILFEVGTAATGGTVTGDGEISVMIDYNDGA